MTHGRAKPQKDDGGLLALLPQIHKERVLPYVALPDSPTLKTSAYIKSNRLCCVVCATLFSH